MNLMYWLNKVIQSMMQQGTAKIIKMENVVKKVGCVFICIFVLIEGRVVQLVFEEAGEGFIFCFLISDL